MDADNFEAKIAEFDAWFSLLQGMSPGKLDPEDWTELWFDGYTPEEALQVGPENKVRRHRLGYR